MKKRSFTLVEALVALVLLGLVVTVFLPAIYNSIQLSDRAEDNFDQALYMENVIEDYKANYFAGKSDKNYENCKIDKIDHGDLLSLSFTFNTNKEENKVQLILPKDPSLYYKEADDNG